MPYHTIPYHPIPSHTRPDQTVICPAVRWCFGEPTGNERKGKDQGQASQGRAGQARAGQGRQGQGRQDPMTTIRYRYLHIYLVLPMYLACPRPAPPRLASPRLTSPWLALTRPTWLTDWLGSWWLTDDSTLAPLCSTLPRYIYAIYSTVSMYIHVLTYLGMYWYGMVSNGCRYCRYCMYDRYVDRYSDSDPTRQSGYASLVLFFVFCFLFLFLF